LVLAGRTTCITARMPMTAKNDLLIHFFIEKSSHRQPGRQSDAGLFAAHRLLP
jgi:hypothetical protein